MNTTTAQFRGGNLPPQAIDWQRCFMAMMWHLLPEGQKSVTLTPKEQQDMLMAFAPADPTLIVVAQPGGESITFTIMSLPEALALAAQNGVAVDPDVGAPPDGRGNVQ